MAINKDDQTKKFTALQADLKQLLTKVTAGCQNWSVQATVSFKKLVKASDAFMKLKPTDDLMQFHKIGNHYDALKKYYNV